MKKILTIFIAIAVNVFSLSFSCQATNYHVTTYEDVLKPSIENKTKNSMSTSANDKSAKNKKIMIICYVTSSIIWGIYLIRLYNLIQSFRAKAKKDAELDSRLLNNRCLTIFSNSESQDRVEPFILIRELLLKLAPDRIGKGCFSKIENFYHELNAI